MQQAQNADDAVRAAALQAISASQNATFAVGGVMIDNATGEVVQAMHNNVLMPFPGSGGPFLLHDPTAHGERQLVDWYFANRDGLPEPQQLTVVTTLDPCAMCAGALLTAGFNVGVSAIDTYAGIDYDERFDFPTLTDALRHQAQNSFGYYGVADPLPRNYTGAASTVFSGQSIDPVTFLLSRLVFESSADSVRAASAGFATDPSQLTDPASLPADSPVRQALASLYPETLQLQFPDGRFADARLAQPLIDVAMAAAKEGNAYDAVALIDPFGNLLLCLGGQEAQSPIRTAFMEVTRGYATLRWRLMNAQDPAVAQQAADCLTHAKYCTFVALHAPDPATSQAVMVLGAYGSTMEAAPPAPFPSSFQYVVAPAAATEEDVAMLAARLPPLYRELIGEAPTRVLDQQLRATVVPPAP